MSNCLLFAISSASLLSGDNIVGSDECPCGLPKAEHSSPRKRSVSSDSNDPNCDCSVDHGWPSMCGDFEVKPYYVSRPASHPSNVPLPLVVVDTSVIRASIAEEPPTPSVLPTRVGSVCIRPIETLVNTPPSSPSTLVIQDLCSNSDGECVDLSIHPSPSNPLAAIVPLPCSIVLRHIPDSSIPALMDVSVAPPSPALTKILEENCLLASCSGRVFVVDATDYPRHRGTHGPPAILKVSAPSVSNVPTHGHRFRRGRGRPSSNRGAGCGSIPVQVAAEARYVVHGSPSHGVPCPSNWPVFTWRVNHCVSSCGHILKYTRHTATSGMVYCPVCIAKPGAEFLRSSNMVDRTNPFVAPVPFFRASLEDDVGDAALPNWKYVKPVPSMADKVYDDSL